MNSDSDIPLARPVLEYRSPQTTPPRLLSVSVVLRAALFQFCVPAAVSIIASIAFKAPFILVGLVPVVFVQGIELSLALPLTNGRPASFRLRGECLLAIWSASTVMALGLVGSYDDMIPNSVFPLSQLPAPQQALIYKLEHYRPLYSIVVIGCFALFAMWLSYNGWRKHPLQILTWMGVGLGAASAVVGTILALQPIAPGFMNGLTTFLAGMCTGLVFWFALALILHRVVVWSVYRRVRVA